MSEHKAKPPDEDAKDTVATAPSDGADVPDTAVDVDALKRERDDYQDRLLRKAAEFDNYRRRVEKERREQADQAVVDLLGELLTVADDFERALAADAPAGAANYRKGVELIHSKLVDLLSKQGIKPITALGADFDPNLHQAVSYEAAPDRRDGEVLEELRKGYMIRDRLLRPAMVKVAKA
jgi:molecular chaperone GrpE